MISCLVPKVLKIFLYLYMLNENISGCFVNVKHLEIKKKNAEMKRKRWVGEVIEATAQ